MTWWSSDEVDVITKADWYCGRKESREDEEGAGIVQHISCLFIAKGGSEFEALELYAVDCFRPQFQGDIVPHRVVIRGGAEYVALSLQIEHISLAQSSRRFILTDQDALVACKGSGEVHRTDPASALLDIFSGSHDLRNDTLKVPVTPTTVLETKVRAEHDELSGDPGSVSVVG